jgi:hypothetical protein
MIERQSLRGTDYHTLAIIGNQSTGKSTILNEIFQTSFETMEQGKGFQQTTKGINASITQNVLMLDIEGADSPEREDGDNFEKKLALLAVATVDVTIINFMAENIGQYRGSNYCLMKNVFEANAKLFEANTKKQIVFFIRDFSTRYNASVLERQLRENVQEICQEISRANTRLSADALYQNFQINFCYFSHKLHASAAFASDAQEVRLRFLDKRNPGYIFREEGGRFPIEGLPEYFSNIWAVIDRNQDLNLPNQKRLVSEARCNQNMRSAFEEYKRLLQSIKGERPDLAQVGDRIQAKLVQALEFYDSKSKSFVSDIYLAKRKELEQLIYQETNSFAATRYAKLKEVRHDEFIRSVLNGLNRQQQVDQLRRDVMPRLSQATSAFTRDVGTCPFLSGIADKYLQELNAQLQLQTNNALTSILQEQQRAEAKRQGDERDRQLQARREAELRAQQQREAAERLRKEQQRLEDERRENEARIRAENEARQRKLAADAEQARLEQERRMREAQQQERVRREQEQARLERLRVEAAQKLAKEKREAEARIMQERQAQQEQFDREQKQQEVVYAEACRQQKILREREQARKIAEQAQRDAAYAAVCKQREIEAQTARELARKKAAEAERKAWYADYLRRQEIERHNDYVRQQNSNSGICSLF